jgi:hypothetical protein
MTHYYPATSQNSGKGLSESMWLLCLPLSGRQAGDTNQAFEVLQGANGQTYVVIPDDFEAVMHPEADPAPIAAMLQYFETAGHIPNGTTAALVAWVEATRELPTTAERTFVLWDKLPAYFQNLAVTELPPEALPATTFSLSRF